MLTGQVIGHGHAQRPSGRGEDYQLIVPTKTTENLATYAAEAKRWFAIVTEYDALSAAGKIPREVYRRAKFGEETLAVAGDNLRLGVCCQIICQGLNGHFLGVVVWAWMTPTDAAINLMVIDPRHISGTPGHDQLRGIGTALVAAVSRQMIAKGGQALFLHPLDRAAERFWVGRGFGNCGGGGLMCIRGRAGVEALLDGCTVRPDCPDAGDCLSCGTNIATSRYRIPSPKIPVPATT